MFVRICRVALSEAKAHRNDNAIRPPGHRAISPVTASSTRRGADASDSPRRSTPARKTRAIAPLSNGFVLNTLRPSGPLQLGEQRKPAAERDRMDEHVVLVDETMPH